LHLSQPRGDFERRGENGALDDAFGL